MGVYIGPLEHYLGFGRKEVYEQWEGEWDCVFYELKKFVAMLLNCKPNVLSLLWLKPNGIIYESSLGERLRSIATSSLRSTPTTALHKKRQLHAASEPGAVATGSSLE